MIKIKKYRKKLRNDILSLGLIDIKYPARTKVINKKIYVSSSPFFEYSYIKVYYYQRVRKYRYKAILYKGYYVKLYDTNIKKNWNDNFQFKYLYKYDTYEILIPFKKPLEIIKGLYPSTMDH